MALQKSYVVPTTGALAAYWRVVSSETLHTAGAIHVWLGGYVDEDARRDGREPVTVRFFRLLLADIPGAADLHGVTTAQLYDAVAAAVNAVPILPNGDPGSPDPLAGAVDA